MKNYLQIFKICFMALCLVFSLHGVANAAANKTNKIKVISKFISVKKGGLLKLAAVDLPQILPYIMTNGDVFQGYEVVIYRNRRALKLRIFNQKTGRVRYVYVDQQSGVIL